MERKEEGRRSKEGELLAGQWMDLSVALKLVSRVEVKV